MSFDEYTPCPGFALVELPKTVDSIGDWVLPESQFSNWATVLKVTPKMLTPSEVKNIYDAAMDHIKNSDRDVNEVKLIMKDIINAFLDTPIKPGMKVSINNITHKLVDDYVVVSLDEIRVYKM